MFFAHDFFEKPNYKVDVTPHVANKLEEKSRDVPTSRGRQREREREREISENKGEMSFVGRSLRRNFPHETVALSLSWYDTHTRYKRQPQRPHHTPATSNQQKFAVCLYGVTVFFF